ncbi:transglutaminase-like domain-containing protein [Chromobacterium haemolyticum]|uniref:transglutaminase-like domain-containing protein n=1 Tax=Chromobacterium haemolyticum TaxID=394935 RepID=UPI0009DA32C7|nr:transglutaminase-like domain-containing protein [Chromobacterium haemolyticum]OQS32395.1 hypothetical protein B0T39_22520 [Chromobacterium haemolyticum]
MHPSHQPDPVRPAPRAGLSLSQALRQVQRDASPDNDRDYCRALHDFVRGHVRFGFTSQFETVTPERTLALGRGHCNAQGDLLRALLTTAGIPARLRFVRLDKRILRHAVPAPVYLCLPEHLFHGLVQARLDGRWLHSDSYLFDPDGFERQYARLLASGLPRGYGLRLGADYRWNADADSFSQASADDLHDDDPVYDSLAIALQEEAGNNTLLGLHFNQWLKLAPPPLRRRGERYLNSRLHPAG